MDTIILKTDAFRMTEEEFFHFCQQNREIRMERDRFQNIFIMSSSGYQSSAINNLLCFQVTQWNNNYKLGIVFDSNGGFTLPNGAVRSPDVSWIAKERHRKLPVSERKRFAHICPDFVIELKSESDSLKLLMEKMDEWMENGCRLGWLIDPEEKKVYIYRPGKQPGLDEFKDKITGEEILPEFALDLTFIKDLE